MDSTSFHARLDASEVLNHNLQRQDNALFEQLTRSGAQYVRLEEQHTKAIKIIKDDPKVINDIRYQLQVQTANTANRGREVETLSNELWWKERRIEVLENAV